MVWLVWFQPGRDGEGLYAVWPDQEAAQRCARELALDAANGSGRITQSLFGDDWEIYNEDSMRFAVRVQEVEFGEV